MSDTDGLVIVVVDRVFPEKRHALGRVTGHPCVYIDFKSRADPCDVAAIASGTCLIGTIEIRNGRTCLIGYRPLHLQATSVDAP